MRRISKPTFKDIPDLLGVLIVILFLVALAAGGTSSHPTSINSSLQQIGGADHQEP